MTNEIMILGLILLVGSIIVIMSSYAKNNTGLMKGGLLIVASLALFAVIHFGCSGRSSENSEEPEEAVSDGTWKIIPMPAETDRLEYSAKLTPEESAKIAEGLVPLEMEDKWYIYLKDNKLYFHRSWTGHCIYTAEIENKDGSYLINQVLVNRNKNQYKGTDNEYDTKILDFLINALLLDKNVEFPMPSGLPDNLPKGVYQHTMTGTGYPESREE